MGIFFSVSLQALDFDQSEKNKHKFMVQSIFVPEGDYNLESLVSLVFPVLSLTTLCFKLYAVSFKGLGCFGYSGRM